MNYPLITEYIEAIKAAEDNLDVLNYLRPVLGEDGEPIMSSGNFAVVFKMKDVHTGKLHAVKCFLKEQEGRSEAYRLIADEMEFVNSSYLTHIKYLDKELFVDTNVTYETEFPVLLMDWIEGLTLDKFIHKHIDNEYVLSILAYQFSRLAMWLLPQPFAHGDLKPDNIIVKEDGTLALVDYDGMYVPAMKGQKARELGSPDFRHPLRTDDDFNERMDDYSLICIALSLKAISLDPSLLSISQSNTGLLISEKDVRDIANSKMIKLLNSLTGEKDYIGLLGAFYICYANKDYSNISFNLINMIKPKKKKEILRFGYFTDSRDGNTYKTIKIGNQIWLAENLRYLPSINNGYHVYGYHGNSVAEAKRTSNYAEYGVLYNARAAQEACPQGWHIPSDEEWKNLEREVGVPIEEVDLFEDEATRIIPNRGKGIGSALLDVNSKCKHGSLIEQKNIDLGFNARLAGWITFHGKHESINELGRWWTTRILHKNDGRIYDYDFRTFRELLYEKSGIGNGFCAGLCCLSLRCIKDDDNDTYQSDTDILPF
jgi:uncharacterized protein (TIGR02145 family)